MFRNVITFSLFLAVLIFNIGELEALEQGDIVYRTSNDGKAYGYNIFLQPYKYPGHTGIYVGEIKSYNSNTHLYYVVEAKWEFTIGGKVEINLLSEFVDLSVGQVYLGAKTTNVEPSSERRENIVQIALDQVGEGYDNNFSNQKGPDCDQWTCVGLTEKAYESADTPDNLQYASSYGADDQNYALDITTDGIAYNNSFTTTVEMSDAPVTVYSDATVKIFFPYTQYSQSTLKTVTHDLNAFPVSSNFLNAIISPGSCETEVSPGGIFGPFTVKESNNSSSYYAFNVQAYVTKPDGTTVNFKKISTGLAAGKTRTLRGYLRIPSSSELGTFTFGAKLTDTNGNLIDDDSFEFTVVSGSTYASKRSDRRLKRLMRNPETQVVEEDGWKLIIFPERNR